MTEHSIDLTDTRLIIRFRVSLIQRTDPSVSVNLRPKFRSRGGVLELEDSRE